MAVTESKHSQRRAGKYARKRARTRRREMLRDAWLPLSIFLGMSYVAIFVVHAIVGGRLGDVWFGMLLAVPLWCVSLAVVGDPSHAYWSSGADGEAWTYAGLRRALPRGWRVVNDVQLDRSNVDHVIVGLSRIIVVETKLRSGTWGTDYGHKKIRAACGQARHNARRLGRRLDEAGIASLPTAVVVLWGGRTARWSNGVRHFEGTEVVRGSSLSEWIAALEPESDATIDVNAVCKLLEEISRRQERV
jgi:hypothetical protein